MFHVCPPDLFGHVLSKLENLAHGFFEEATFQHLLIEHVPKNQEETNETSLMEKFPKNQEAQSQNINHGSFSKNIWKQNLKVLLIKSYQKIRNQISIFQQWKIFRRSGIKISKYYSWKICKNARIPHVQQVSMVAFQKNQETRSQNTPGSFSNMSGSNL